MLLTECNPKSGLRVIALDWKQSTQIFTLLLQKRRLGAKCAVFTFLRAGVNVYVSMVAVVLMGTHPARAALRSRPNLR
jgi:hypothetical protein